MAATKKEDKIQKFLRMNSQEDALHIQGFSSVAGLDEAGRGPLAGPVYAAAVILDPDQPILGLDDSKKLSEKKRMELAIQIKEKALAYKIVSVDPQTIDEINILQATKQAMYLAVSQLSIPADYLLCDAIVLPQFSSQLQRSVIKGDASCNCIAAASILAKTGRDAEMYGWAEVYPQYGFDRHKGYGTAYHYAALDQFGPCPIHRKSFLKTWYQRPERSNDGQEC